MGLRLVTDALAWHREVLERRPRRLTSVVAGAAIAVRSWGDTAAPSVVLLHGGAAHGGWWDLVAPALADRFHVLAPDLSGHGDSDWRTAYGLEAWSAEVARVVRDHTTTPRPVLVGHSMGGHVALALGRNEGARLGGVVVVDSELRKRESGPRRRRWTAIDPQQRPVYQDETTILSRFRTLPDDCRAPSLVLDHVARQAVIGHVDGWSWKFDRRFVEHEPLVQEDLAPLACPVRVIRGEHGLVGADMAASVEERLRPRLPTVTVADAGHHVPLEEPRRLAGVISEIATAWSTPSSYQPLENR
ncbi:alpha/beta fold hydrolase [Nocardioides terrigena]|uniref:alpha/beta fold hydrolase n=1 Tax=Nocardioides terrigena TaxID=424797 RepID=UPI00131F3889|nr:alpha/beta hydrolase [Nocardioides terrigena]